MLINNPSTANKHAWADISEKYTITNQSVMPTPQKQPGESDDNHVEEQVWRYPRMRNILNHEGHA